ncbi:hypothetical protein BRC87_06290 [Halobacteriales archaeon QS_4_66_20]|nr:MAG: hypothetical protein BRC87_06290 [Halobacteriales archaeon QS_4_66_20]
MVGHVHLKVRDVERAVEFYAEVLSLNVEERHNCFAFLSSGERHHDVALQEVGRGAPGPGEGVGLYHAAFEVPGEGVGLYHAAFEVADVEALVNPMRIRLTPPRKQGRCLTVADRPSSLSRRSPGR